MCVPLNLKEKACFGLYVFVIAVFLGGIILLSSGCSHNPAGLTIGKKLKLGTTEYEASYLDGVGFLDVPRENSSWEIEINDQDGLSWDAETQTLKGVKKIKRTVGRQVTGYLVELAKEAPEAAKVWLAGDRNAPEKQDAEPAENLSDNADPAADAEALAAETTDDGIEKAPEE